MTTSLAPLILDFLEWLAVKPRPYAEVMDAWRTSCPRFTIWEDVLEQGFVLRRWDAATGQMVDLTAVGRSFFATSGRARQLAS